jgi:hypothetical protein
MLDDVVLLWVVRRHVLMMHALSRTIVREFCRGELASTVGAKCLHLKAGLTLCPCLDVLDGNSCTILGRNRSYPHVPAKIIHKQQKVLVTLLALPVRLDRTSCHALAPDVIPLNTPPSPGIKCVITSHKCPT